jgi:hypothetical protein
MTSTSILVSRGSLDAPCLGVDVDGTQLSSVCEIAERENRFLTVFRSVREPKLVAMRRKGQKSTAR